jgi:hypothetical protein
MAVVIAVEGQRNLAHVTHALGAGGSAAHPLDRRCRHAQKNGNNGDGDEKLD